MGSTRAPHHAGQRPALPGAMCTRSPAAVAPIMPVTACIVGAGLKPAPTNDGVYPPTAPCGPAARAPRSNVHPFTRCCRTDHARHRMHSGGRFETCPHYGVLIHQTMGSTRPPHHAGQRLAFPGTMCTRSPAGVAPIMPVTACIVGAGLKPAPTNDGVYPRTAPCGPAARTPRSNVHPFTRCCRTDHARHRMHSGGRFETCPH
jgi:hypothetical protein